MNKQCTGSYFESSPEKTSHIKGENEMCETGGAVEKAAGCSRHHSSLRLICMQTFLFISLTQTLDPFPIHSVVLFAPPSCLRYFCAPLHLSITLLSPAALLSCSVIAAFRSTSSRRGSACWDAPPLTSSWWSARSLQCTHLMPSTCFLTFQPDIKLLPSFIAKIA